VSVCKLASGVTKYHAQITNHREFVIDALPCVHDLEGEVQDVSWPIAFRLPSLNGSSDAPLIAERGSVLAVVAPGHANSLLPSLFERVLESPAAGARAPRPVLVDSDLVAPDLNLRANFGVPPELSEEALEPALAPFSPPGQDFEFLPPGWLDRSLDELGTLPRWLLKALPVLSVRARGRPIVAMDLARFAPMSRHWREACRAALADRLLLLIHRRPTSVGKYGEQAAILCDGRALQGWLPVEDPRSSKKNIAHAFSRMTRTPVVQMDPLDSSLAEFDEDDEE
jgi:hypothetical protein